MRFNPTARKAISALLVLLLMAGLYGVIVALCNQYLREHDMLTNVSRFVLGLFLFAGFYFIYKWFLKRIETIQNSLIIIMMCAMLSFGCNPNGNIVSVSALDFEKGIKTDTVQLLDVRTPQEYAEGHIGKAININVQSDDFQLLAEKELSKDSTVLVYCRSGRRSMDAAELLTKLGYKVVNLKGGIIEWGEEGLPVISGAASK